MYNYFSLYAVFLFLIEADSIQPPDLSLRPIILVGSEQFLVWKNYPILYFVQRQGCTIFLQLMVWFLKFGNNLFVLTCSVNWFAS